MPACGGIADPNSGLRGGSSNQITNLGSWLIDVAARNDVRLDAHVWTAPGVQGLAAGFHGRCDGGHVSGL